MNRAEALKKLRTFAGALKARGATSLYLFGSTAASRHLGREIKSQHKDVRWKDIAGIGNI